MFSRRHPYLFAFLTLSGILAACLVALALVLSLAGAGGFADLRPLTGAKVGVVEVGGVITDSREVIQQLKDFRADDSIRAIVLRINSPGGVVGPAQEIHREVVKTTAQKKVVASMGAVAASGGYYVAAGADGIMASPGTITGSIGVIMEYTNFEELLKKIGLAPVVVKSGVLKDMGSPVREMTAEERDVLQAFVAELHGQFVAAIAEGRGLETAAVERLADGRIYTGETAQGLGLVDRIGNLEDAVEWAGRLAGETGPVTAVYGRPRRISLLKTLTESIIASLAEHGWHPEATAGYIYRPGAPSAP
jgi:protease-4